MKLGVGVIFFLLTFVSPLTEAHNLRVSREDEHVVTRTSHHVHPPPRSATHHDGVPPPPRSGSHHDVHPETREHVVPGRAGHHEHEHSTEARTTPRQGYEPGRVCDKHSECKYNRCVWANEHFNTRKCGQCSQKEHCPKGFNCDYDPSVCVQGGEAGATCNRYHPVWCASQVCGEDNKCKGKADGATCEVDKECESSSYCEPSSSKCTKRPPTPAPTPPPTRPTAPTPAPTTMCMSDAWCNPAQMCSVGICINRPPSPPPTPYPTYRPNPPTPWPTPQPTPPPTPECTKDSDCGSGRSCAFQSICFP